MNLQWRLDDLFKSDDECYAAFDEVGKLLDDALEYKEISLDEDNLLDMLDRVFEIKSLSYKCLVYGSLRYYQDVKNEETIKLKSEVEKLNNRTVGNLTFIEGIILGQGEEVIQSFIKKNTQLEKYRVYLDNLFRTKKHNVEDSRITTLKDEINEKILEYNETLKAIKLDSIEVDGKETELTVGNAPKFLAASNGETRKQAFLSLNKGHSLKRETVARILDEIVKRRVEISRIRGYESPLEEALDEENISPVIVSELIKVVEDNKKLLRRYMKMQAKFHGITKPHLYDLGRANVTGSNKKYPLEEGIDILRKAFGPLGDKYTSVAYSLMQNGHIDATVDERKHPTIVFSWLGYSFLNYRESITDLKNLAHELGHSINDYLSQGLPFPYQISTVFVGETASIVNEILLNKHLILESEENEGRLFYLGKEIDNYVTSIFRQTMYTEFELKIYERVQNGEELTSEFLEDVYFDILKSYYGEEITYDEESRYEWIRLGHIFRWAFYPYKYATGLLIASTVYENLMNGLLSIDEYMKFLASGSCEYSMDLLRMLHIDMTDLGILSKGFENMNKDLDELEVLLEDLKEKSDKKYINEKKDVLTRD